MTIIRDQNAIAEASTADLLETYNAYTGKNITRFSSRAAGEVQVVNSILAATDASAHAGVPKGSAPRPRTLEELADLKPKQPTEKESTKMATATAKKAARAATAKPKTPKVAGEKRTPKTPKVAGEKRTLKPRAVFTRVKFIDNKEHKPHEGSTRFALISALRKRGEASLEQLAKDTSLEAPKVRGNVLALISLGWAVPA